MNLYSLLIENITQQELLNYYNAIITYENMPDSIDGCLFCYNNINNIMINKNLSYFKRKEAILHELAHIELNQLNQCDNDLFAFKVDEYEDEADKYIKLLLESIKLDKTC